MSEIVIQKNQLAVVGAADENYARYLLVAFVSALLNTSDRTRLKLFCLSGGISAETQEVMQKKVKELGSIIVFIEVDGARYDQYKVIKHLSKVAYYRLSIPEIFFNKTDRVLYLDCDLIVTGDLLSLLEVEFDGQPVAAVEDISKGTHKSTGLQRKEYINSGVMLINVDEWINQNINNKVFSALENQRIDNDQCAINIALNGFWLRLPLAWNYQSGIYRNKSYLQDNYGCREVEDVFLYPKVIHFVGSDKPWNKVCYHPWEKDYMKYANISGVDIVKLKEFSKFIYSIRSFKNFKKYIRSFFRRASLKKL